MVVSENFLFQCYFSLVIFYFAYFCFFSWFSLAISWFKYYVFYLFVYNAFLFSTSLIFAFNYLLLCGSDYLPYPFSTFLAGDLICFFVYLFIIKVNFLLIHWFRYILQILIYSFLKNFIISFVFPILPESCLIDFLDRKAFLS